MTFDLNIWHNNLYWFCLDQVQRSRS